MEIAQKSQEAHGDKTSMGRKPSEKSHLLFMRPNEPRSQPTSGESLLPDTAEIDYYGSDCRLWLIDLVQQSQAAQNYGTKMMAEHESSEITTCPRCSQVDCCHE